MNAHLPLANLFRLITSPLFKEFLARGGRNELLELIVPSERASVGTRQVEPIGCVNKDEIRSRRVGQVGAQQQCPRGYFSAQHVVGVFVVYAVVQLQPSTSLTSYPPSGCQSCA